MVAQVPPAWLGFEHCGNLVWMCESGMYVGPAVSQLKLPRVPKSLSDRLMDGLTDHLTYTAYVVQLRYHCTHEVPGSNPAE